MTIARSLSDTFAGIAPASVPPFVLMQLIGGALGAAVVLLLHPVRGEAAASTDLTDTQQLISEEKP